MRVFPIVIPAFLLFTGTACAGIEEGKAAYTKGDYTLALKEFEPLAQKGDAEALYRLGLLYSWGRGVEKDDAKMIVLWRQAAEAGYGEAAFALYSVHNLGIKGLSRDPAQEAKYLRMAAENGHALSQSLLAGNYQYGRGGFEKDLQKAFYWTEKAAAQNYAPAQYSLGWAYERGDGVAADPQKAVEWYRRAADQNNATAQIKMAELYGDGKLVPQDYRQAIAWYRKLAERESSDEMEKYLRSKAQYELANLYSAGSGVAADESEAAKLLSEAAANGYSFSYYPLAIRYLNGNGVGADLAQAVHWLQLAARNDTKAQSLLSLFYARGIGVPRDPEKARALMNERAARQEETLRPFVEQVKKQRPNNAAETENAAADMRNVSLAYAFAEAHYILGTMYQNGMFTPKDPQETITLFRTAANIGYKPAIEALRKLQ